MSSRVILGSLAMDLKRSALGYYYGSETVGKRFAQEARIRKSELQNKNLKPYLKKLLSQMDEILSQKNHKKLAEDALLYSTLFQNASHFSI